MIRWAINHMININMCDKDRKKLFKRNFRRYDKDEVEVGYD